MPPFFVMRSLLQSPLMLVNGSEPVALVTHASGFIPAEWISVPLAAVFPPAMLALLTVKLSPTALCQPG